MDKPKTLDELVNEYAFIEIIPEDDDKDYGDVTDPEQAKGFWLEDDDFEDIADLDLERPK